jgi:hypothetical protein
MNVNVAARSLQEDENLRRAVLQAGAAGSGAQATGALRLGGWVALSPPEGVLAMLDGAGACEGVPFTPEMLRYYGQALTVERRVE